MSVLVKCVHFFFEKIFPPYCCYCRKDGTLLCADCYEEIIFLFLPISLKLDYLYLDSVFAAAQYTQVIKSLVTAMKYDHVKAAAKVCGRLLYYTVSIPTCDYITFVPMHQKKADQRGYNQAEVMAAEIATFAHIPYHPFLIKKKQTQSQASVKNKIIRKYNTQNTYAVNKKFLEKIKGKKILVIDDVCTTGSTLNECAKVLKKAGAQQVCAVVLTHKSS